MLFNPKWDNGPRLDVMSQKSLLQSLVAWLETQDPFTAYRWSDLGGNCLIGRWTKAIGLNWSDVNRRDDSGMNIYTRTIKGNALALSSPHTFGAALKRARAALSDAR